MLLKSSDTSADNLSEGRARLPTASDKYAENTDPCFTSMQLLPEGQFQSFTHFLGLTESSRGTRLATIILDKYI